MRGGLAQPAAVLVDRLGQRRREAAHARLVVADRQQRHERAAVGALEADAALVQRAIDGDAVGQRRAHVDDQLERVARADRRVREHAVVEQLHAVDRADQLARQRREAERVRRAARGRAPRAARASGRSSRTGWPTGSSSRARRRRRPAGRGRGSRVSRASSTAPGVNEVSALCVEIATASAPSASAEAGTSGWKPKCPAQAWSQISGMPRACASSAMRATCETTPSQDGSTSRIARASGLGLERGLDRLDGMAERDAARLVDGGRDPHRPRAREHEAGGDRLVRAARDDHRLALGRDREAERLVGVRRAVAREAAEVGAEGRRGERLGARADPLAAAQVVGAAVHRRVVGEQRVVADQRAGCACGRASRTPSAPRAGTRRRRRRTESREPSRRQTLWRTAARRAAARSCRPRSRRARPSRSPRRA